MKSDTAFDLILFDLDGTLIDTAPEIADAVNAWLGARNLPQHPESRVRGWIGQGSRELMIRAYATASGEPEAALRHDGVASRLMQEFSGHFVKHSGRNSRLFPRVTESLAQLRASGCRLAIVTNKDWRFTEPVLKAHGLASAFDLVVCGDTLPTRKPDPEGVRHCLRHFDVAAQRALFVGDSDIDVATARNAGVAIWAVPYGYNGGRPVADAGPDRMIDDLSALAAQS